MCCDYLKESGKSKVEVESVTCLVSALICGASMVAITSVVS